MVRRWDEVYEKTPKEWGQGRVPGPASPSRWGTDVLTPSVLHSIRVTPYSPSVRYGGSAVAGFGPSSPRGLLGLSNCQAFLPDVNPCLLFIPLSSCFMLFAHMSDMAHGQLLVMDPAMLGGLGAGQTPGLS